MCNQWEENKIYSGQFMELLRKKIDAQIQISQNKNYLVETQLRNYNDFLIGLEIDLDRSEKEIEK